MYKLRKLKGGEPMELYTQTSGDWNNSENYKSYAVNLDVGINEYVFGRTTPSNEFVVASGLTNGQHGIKMIGGKKNKEYKVVNKNVYIYEKKGNKYIKTKNKAIYNNTYNGKMIYDKSINTHYIDIGNNCYLPIIKYNTGEILISNS